jgi:hypothetical protein
LRRGLEVAAEEFAEDAGVSTIFAVVVLQILSSIDPGALLATGGLPYPVFLGNSTVTAVPLPSSLSTEMEPVVRSIILHLDSSKSSLPMVL